MKLEIQDIEFEDILRAKGYQYQLYPPGSEQEKNITSFLINSFPICISGRVDWKKVKDSKFYYVRCDTGGVKCIQRLCKELKLEGEISILWSNALKPALSISLENALEHLMDIIQEESDTWILNLEDKWCIEFYHDDEVGFGYANNFIEAGPTAEGTATA